MWTPKWSLADYERRISHSYIAIIICPAKYAFFYSLREARARFCCSMFCHFIINVTQPAQQNMVLTLYKKAVVVTQNSMIHNKYEELQVLVLEPLLLCVLRIYFAVWENICRLNSSSARYYDVINQGPAPTGQTYNKQKAIIWYSKLRSMCYTPT